ncbi:hypothetical protein LCGC14_0972010 [marine sediment metagenome]|uniref:Uncharacterized protein n=1 Tax=marine sediment metagenome TaxID=412755 RepID=A0A0F9QUK3_9ZZZZ
MDSLEMRPYIDAAIALDRQAMAEWSIADCDEHPPHARRARMFCPVCVSNLFVATREGKAPWEEQDAVHNARKTPRTMVDMLYDRNYTELSAAIGDVECAKLEVYRRVLGPYEDEKITEHGDVF